MVVLIRVEMSDEEMRVFKERIGTKATRKAVSAEVLSGFKRTLYPDGVPQKKKSKFKLRG